MHYLSCEYANVTDNRTGEIKFPRDDRFRNLSPAINIVTSDCMYDLDNVADSLMILDERHITYIWTDSKNRMHPTNLKDKAERIIAFAKKDFQWIVFTNSLFFIKELKLLAKKENLDVKYINLYYEGVFDFNYLIAHTIIRGLDKEGQQGLFNTIFKDVEDTMIGKKFSIIAKPVKRYRSSYTF